MNHHRVDKNFKNFAIIVFLVINVQRTLSAAVRNQGQWNNQQLQQMMQMQQLMQNQHQMLQAIYNSTAPPSTYKTTPTTTGLRVKKIPHFSSSTAASVEEATRGIGRRTTSIINLSSGNSDESYSSADQSDEMKLEIKVRNKKRPGVPKNKNGGQGNNNNGKNNKKKQNNNRNNNNNKRKDDTATTKKKKPVNNKNQQPKKDVKKLKNAKPGDADSESDLLTDLAQGYKTVYSKVTHWWKDLESSFSLTPVVKSEGNKKVKKDTHQPPKESKAPPKKKKNPPPKKKQTQSWFDLEKFVMFLGAVVTVLDIFGIR